MKPKIGLLTSLNRTSDFQFSCHTCDIKTETLKNIDFHSAITVHSAKQKLKT